MATKVNKAQVARLERAYRSAVSRAKRMKEESESIVGQVQTAALTGGTAFAMGYVEHRFRGDDGSPGVEILGVPLSLGVGIGGHLASIFGAGGKYSEALQSVANGALASYATTLGAGMGTAHWQQQGNAMAPASSEGVGRADLRDLAGL